THTPSLSHTHTPSISHSYKHTRAHTPSLSLPLSHTHSLSLSLSFFHKWLFTELELLLALPSECRSASPIIPSKLTLTIPYCQIQPNTPHYTILYYTALQSTVINYTILLYYFVLC